MGLMSTEDVNGRVLCAGQTIFHADPAQSGLVVAGAISDCDDGAGGNGGVNAYLALSGGNQGNMVMMNGSATYGGDSATPGSLDSNQWCRAPA
jgi:hypothetical protein